MRFGDLLVQAMGSSGAAPAVLEQLRLEGNRLSLQAGAAAAMADGGAVARIEARESEFGWSTFTNMPLSYSEFLRSSSQSIPDSAWTGIDFTFGGTYNPPKIVSWSSATNPSRFYFDPNGEHFLLVVGSVDWAANSSGDRRLALQSFDSSDALVSQLNLNVAAAPVAPAPPTQPFVATIAPSGDGYMSLVALQNTGAPLYITYANLSVFKVGTFRTTPI